MRQLEVTLRALALVFAGAWMFGALTVLGLLSLPVLLVTEPRRWRR